MKPWYEQFPDRFDWEREALTNKGFSLVHEQKNSYKKIVFEGTINVQNKDYHLTISFPTGYPYFPPECFCTDADFQNSAHILPKVGKLCLLEEWKTPENVNGLQMLERSIEWMSKTLSSGFDEEEAIDAPEPKQYSQYNQNLRGVLLTSESLVKKDWGSGEGQFSVQLSRYDWPGSTYSLYKGGLYKVAFGSNHHISNESELNLLLSEGVKLSGAFFTVETAPPYFTNQKQLIAWLEANGYTDILKKCRRAGRHLRHKRGEKKVPFLGPLLGVKYKDEVGQKGNLEEQFLLVSLDYSTPISGKIYRFPFVIFQSETVSPSKLARRTPDLQPLKKKHALVLGLGTIGSSVSLDLAKAGIGSLTIVDKDVVSVGNINRQAYGIDQVGFFKSQALHSILLKHSPYTRVNDYIEEWGSNTENRIISERLRTVDVIICAAGHTPTELFLDHLSSHFNIPVIYAYCSEGAWSGRVMKVIPGETGCYFCHREFKEEDKELALTRPTAGTEVYDDGCATPAFTGSGIDTGVIANLTARLAIQTMVSDTPETYEQTEVDHFVWRSQGTGGTLSLVQKTLGVHSNCPKCNPV